MLWENIIKRTPVDTGRARSNWNVSKNLPDTTVSDSTVKSVTLQDVPPAKGDEDYYITNNLPYIKMLEYGGYSKNSTTGKTVNGFSKQAPHGMVGVTVADAQRLYDEALRSGK